jgi:hypothetical protein
MSLLGSIWDTVGELIVWSRASANEVAGKGQVAVAKGEDRDDTEHCALPGHYSVIASNDEIMVLRRDDGAISVVARTARPSDAVTGERGWTHAKGGLTRVKDGLLGGTVFEIKGNQTGVADPVTGILVGGGISLGSTGAVVKQVIRATDVVVTPLGVSVGACKGTTLLTGSE